MKNVIKKFGFWAIISIIGLVSLLLYKSKETKPISEIKNCVDNIEVELLAATPEGTKIYKIRGDKLIVPIILVQTNNGNISIR